MEDCKLHMSADGIMVFDSVLSEMDGIATREVEISIVGRRGLSCPSKISWPSKRVVVPASIPPFRIPSTSEILGCQLAQSHLSKDGGQHPRCARSFSPKIEKQSWPSRTSLTTSSLSSSLKAAYSVGKKPLAAADTA